MKLNILVTLFVLVSFKACFADVLTEEKRKDIVELLDLMQGEKLSYQLADAIVSQQTSIMSDDKRTRNQMAVIKEVTLNLFKESFPELTKKMVKLYSKYFTHEEIKKLLAFYKTDIGKKTIKVMPGLLQESIFLSQEWADELIPEVQKRVQNRLKEIESPSSS
ncbi:DUF2059 domain-containing protein [Pleionea sediminis]|uniref:DUF2059 domain-containing protein n=1 Tax=Pleionea sediminis TaxID=2569479 RepID=UPI001184B78F|nr:DUF2059 domain-containing protein [Pleionea sediminis]